MELSDGEKRKFWEYEKFNQKAIRTIIDKQVELSREEKIYLWEFNRHKINPGVEKEFVTIKKKRMYFDMM